MSPGSGLIGMIVRCKLKKLCPLDFAYSKNWKLDAAQTMCAQKWRGWHDGQLTPPGPESSFTTS